MMVQQQHGFTLAELLLALAIAGILSMGATSLWQQVSQASYRATAINRLVGAFRLARNNAITQGRLTTICPLNQQQRCSNNWQLPIVVFSDPGNQRRLSANSQVIRQLPALEHGRFVVKPGRKRYFQFDPDGTSHGTLGHVTYCPGSQDLTLAAQLVLSRVGRVRLSEDRDDDNIIDPPSGGPLDC